MQTFKFNAIGCATRITPICPSAYLLRLELERKASEEARANSPLASTSMLGSQADAVGALLDLKGGPVAGGGVKPGMEGMVDIGSSKDSQGVEGPTAQRPSGGGGAEGVHLLRQRSKPLRSPRGPSLPETGGKPGGGPPGSGGSAMLALLAAAAVDGGRLFGHGESVDPINLMRNRPHFQEISWTPRILQTMVVAAAVVGVQEEVGVLPQLPPVGPPCGPSGSWTPRRRTCRKGGG